MYDTKMSTGAQLESNAANTVAPTSSAPPDGSSPQGADVTGETPVPTAEATAAAPRPAHAPTPPMAPNAHDKLGQALLALVNQPIPAKAESPGFWWWRAER